jgi:hypothetical protein
MRKAVDEIINEIIDDKTLLPYFVDYIGENLKTAFKSQMDAHRSDNLKFEEIASNKFIILLEKLGST